MSVLNRILEAWIGAVCRFAWVVILIVSGATYFVFGYTVENLTINTNTTDMLSEELPFRQNYIAYKSAFPKTGDLMTIVIDAQTPDRADTSAEKLAERLRLESKTIETVYDFGGDPFFRRNGLLYLEIDDLEGVADRLSQAQGLLGALSEETSLRRLSEVFGLAIDDMVDDNEPIGDLTYVFERIADVVSARSQGTAAELSWQGLMAGEGPDGVDTRRFLQVRVNSDWSTISPAAPAMDTIREAAAELGLTPVNGVRVRLAGGLALSTEELTSVFDGAKAASFLSLAMVSICLFLGLRSLVLVGAIVLTLVCGLIWTAGFAVAAVGHLNLLSVAFAVLFIGLGVDFGIHFALRYAEAVRNGVGRVEALHVAAVGVGGVMALCAVSAAIGFYAFLPTAYLGLAELGLISGTGMFIALFMSLSLLPALLSLFPFKPMTLASGTVAAKGAQALRRHGGTVTIGIAVFAAVSLLLAPKVRFDFDPLNLHDPNAESLQTTLDLIRDSDTSPKTISAIRPNLEAARELATKLEALPEVSKAVSISNFVPNAQEEKLAIIGNLSFVMLPVFGVENRSGTVTADKEVKALREFSAKLALVDGKDGLFGKAAKRLRKEIDAFVTGTPDERAVASLRIGLLEHFPRLIDQLRDALEAGDVSVDDVPQGLKERYLAENGIARVEVTPAFSVETNSALRKFIDAVRTIAPDATDSPVVILEASQAVIDAILQAAATAGVLIIVLLFAMLRSIRDTLLVFYPLVVAGLFTVATVVAFDLPFNFANVVVLPLLMGLGVASGIHLVMRGRLLDKALALQQTSTPRAVLYSALTTILSFGSLAISAHRGTASMGALLMIAIGFTLFGGLVALPALTAWLDRCRQSQRSRCFPATRRSARP